MDIQTTITDSTLQVQSMAVDVPQVQTVVQEDNMLVAQSLINAPFIEVTSINGRTGDVILDPLLRGFTPGELYETGTMITYQQGLYWAKHRFIAGSTFDPNDWQKLEEEVYTTWNKIIDAPTDVSFFNNDANYVSEGDNVSLLTNDADYVAVGDNISGLNNDSGYLLPNDNITQLTNNAGYVSVEVTDVDPGEGTPMDPNTMIAVY